MSSRVQKGGTIFKPVGKSRIRTGASSARQISVALEPHAEPPAIRRSPSSTRRLDQPPPIVAPSYAFPATHDFQNRLSTENTIPTVIPSQLQPPVVMQANRQLSTKEQLASSFAESRIANGHRETTQVVSPHVSQTSLFIPMTSPSPPPLLVEERASMSHERSNDIPQGDGGKQSKKRRVSKRAEKDSEPRSSRSESRSNRVRRPRKRASSPLPFDQEANAGEDIDPTAVTMATLCVDTGQGRISTKAAEIVNNHAAWKLKSREKRTRIRALMEAKKYGRPDDETDNISEKLDHVEDPLPMESTTVVASSSTTTTIADETGNGFDYSQDLTTSRYNVQVRIGPNGETVIDEDSLVVDRTETQGTENLTHVTESDYTKFVNSATYGKRFRGSRWSAEETELFYDALSQFGENYELIAYILPGRDRKACKNKFKVEDKKNPTRISYCLDNRIPVDISTLSRMTGKDFSGPVPEIRAPQQIQSTIAPRSEQIEANPTEESLRPVERKNRSRIQGVSNGEVIVIGDVDHLQFPS